VGRRRHDPLRNPEPLIRDVYAYVSYRLPNGADAEEITSRVFERAVRYRDSFDPDKGTPISWLIGIARTQLAGHHTHGAVHAELDEAELANGEDLEASLLESLAVRDAVRSLDDRSRELIALRYGVGLSSGDIAAELDMTTNAVDVALHRARQRLRELLVGQDLGRAAASP
jgi:RNA polymerase sigma factor (sigma-70 family)